MVNQNRYVESLCFLFFGIQCLHICILIASLLKLFCGLYKFDSSINSGRVVMNKHLEL